MLNIEGILKHKASIRKFAHVGCSHTPTYSRAAQYTTLHSEHAIAAAPCSHLGLRLLLLLLPLLLGCLLLVVLLPGVLQPPLDLLKSLTTAQLGLNLLARARTKVSTLQKVTL
jgi:hypothetical protein